MNENTATQDLQSLDKARKFGKKVVFTNGCFDLLHVGHIRYLADAKCQGDILVVGLNSDESVKLLKGEFRPIVFEQERKEMLLALKAVDYVFVFSEETPLQLIKKIKPDVLVKGGDWPVEKIVGYDFVKSYGGEVRSLLFIEGRSSTNIIKRIQDLG